MALSELKRQFGAFQFYVLLIVIIGLTGYVGFHFGNERQSRQAELISINEQSIQNLTTENQKLSKSLNILGVELEVAKLAQQQHAKKIQQALARENELKTDLAFYQQVMAPELNKEGFLIEGFYVEPTLSDDSYRFELVLMQQNKIKNTLKGNLKVQLIGSEKSQSKAYLMSTMLPDKKSLTFSFKYFQVLEGEIKLPSEFQPEKVSVHAEIYQFKRKKGELTTTFDWLTRRE